MRHNQFIKIALSIILGLVCIAAHADDRDGYLNDDGHIIWNTGKLMQRLSTATPEICLGCKLYPTCLGACSQCILEQPQGKCYFNDATNINDLILIHLNQTRFQLKSK